MSGFIVGLTGGIASGKSEATRRFEALGIVVADADVAAREVVAPGSAALEQIGRRFGSEMLLADGTLNRARLREQVFGNDEERRALEAITHPAIRARVRDLCETADGPYAIAAIPLLAEAGGRATYPWLDRIVVVDAPESVRHARLRQRDGIDDALATRMIQAQAGRDQRLALADDVIVNDGHPSRLQPQVETLDRLYRQLASGRACAP